jgi:excisionase family DNA binding protein
MPDERLLTTAQVAERVGVNEDTVRRWIREKRLPAYMPGGTKTGYRVRAADLDRYLEDSRTAAA